MRRKALKHMVIEPREISKRSDAAFALVALEVEQFL